MLTDADTVVVSAFRWRKDNLKQLFNVVYFSSSAVLSVLLAKAYGFWSIYFVAALFTLFAIAACAALCLTPRAVSKVSLTKINRLLVRRLALIGPIPLCLLYIASLGAEDQCAKGQEQLARADYAQAITNLEHAIFLNPRLVKAHQVLGSAYAFTKEYEKSLQEANKAIEIDPANSLAYGTKAWDLDCMRKPNEALAVALTAAKLNPTDGEAQHALARIYKQLGQLDNALAAADKHIYCHRYEPDAFNLRADIFESLGQTEEANMDRNTAMDLQWLLDYHAPVRQ